MKQTVDQAIKGIQDSVAKTIQESSVEVKATSTTDQLVDGFMSGSTITKVVYIVVIGGGLISVLVILIKVLGGKSEPDYQLTQSIPQYYDPMQY